MATTQKKTSAPKASSAGRSGTKKRPAAPPPPAYNHAARITAGVICLILCLCVTATYFGVDAIFLSFFAGVLKGLFGYGYWLFAVALLYAGVVLVNHKGQPVIARTVCTLLLPVLLGIVLHLFLCRDTYHFAMADMKPLWTAGQALTCGGVVSGAIAAGAMALLSKVVSAILFILLLLAALVSALHISPRELAAQARERASLAAMDTDEDEDDLIPPAREKERKKPVKAADGEMPPVIIRGGVPIDIPLPGEESRRPAIREAEILKPGGGLLRRRGSDVKTPAEALRGETAVQNGTAAAAAADAPTQSAAPAVQPQPAPALPLREVPPAAKKKLVAQEVQEATAEVSEAIEKELAEEDGAYRYPPITLLEENTGGNVQEAGAELRSNARRLFDTLRSFGVDARPGEVIHGPSVTRYEFMLDQGVKLSKLTNLSDDIALALGASGVRIAPVPGKISAVGIEVPNRSVTAVRIRDVIESRTFTESSSAVAFAVGKDIAGNCIVGNIGRLPHVLIAGTTGSGKSVCTNSLIISLLYKSTPDEVRFIMVDPKMVELAPYNGIPHLLIPVVTDPKKAAGALQWAVYEMMKRYKIFSQLGVKDLSGYNTLCENGAAQGREDVPKKMPTVVVVIDELADLMLVAAKEVEESICRVAQMGRAAGVHLVIATQRPSADVITGLMKANIPSRIAFAVASSLESRIILDTTGAEKLVGKGDMLYFPLGDSKPTRVQGCFITPEEIERVVSFVKESGEADYSSEVMEKIEEAMQQGEKGSKSGSANNGDVAARDDCDELLDAAVEVVLETGQASVSMLQRRLKLGYSRAARLVDQMEERGIVGPFEGSKPRQLLISREKWQEAQMQKNPALAAEVKPVDPYGSISDMFNSHDAMD